MTLVDVLGGEIGPRPAGSDAAERAAHAVAAAFRDLGVEPTFQEFPSSPTSPTSPSSKSTASRWPQAR